MVGQEGDVVHFAVRADAVALLDRLLAEASAGSEAGRARAGVGRAGRFGGRSG
jgi:hypothetical protein